MIWCLKPFYHQCWRQLRGDAGHQGDAVQRGPGGVEAAGHLPLLLRDGRGVLPLRRADLRHEVRQLDLRRLPGEASSGIFGCSLKESPDPISALDRVRCSIYWGDEMWKALLIFCWFWHLRSDINFPLDRETKSQVTFPFILSLLFTLPFHNDWFDFQLSRN